MSHGKIWRNVNIYHRHKSCYFWQSPVQLLTACLQRSSNQGFFQHTLSSSYRLCLLRTNSNHISHFLFHYFATRKKVDIVNMTSKTQNIGKKSIHVDGRPKIIRLWAVMFSFTIYLYMFGRLQGGQKVIQVQIMISMQPLNRSRQNETDFAKMFLFSE